MECSSVRDTNSSSNGILTLGKKTISSDSSCQEVWKKTKLTTEEEFHVPVEIQQKTIKLLADFNNHLDSI